MSRSASSYSVDVGAGAPMPLIGFGTYDIPDDAYTAVRTALEVGYRHVDTAYGYRNEDEIGRAIADSAVPREDIFITTKIPSRRLDTAQDVAEQSLRALRTDYVDLWLIHDPPQGQQSVQLWEFFLGLRERGAARAVGVSNYSTEQIDELVAATGVTPAVNQIRWAPAYFDRGRLRELRERGIQLEGFSAIRRTNLEDPRLRAIGDAHGVSAAQVVLRWHIEHEISTLPRSTNPSRIRQNFDVWDFALTPDEVAGIDAMSTADAG